LKVLIIEDNAEIVEAVSLCLQLRWPDVAIKVSAEGSRGLEFLGSGTFDIVILDVNLPDIDGFEVLKKLRMFSNVPVIMHTVREREDDQTMGLELGADDYIVKPFRPRDLVARVNAVLRRAQPAEAQKEKPYISRGKLTLNIATNEVNLDSTIKKLTPIEARLLYMLMENNDTTIKGEELSLKVWSKEQYSTDGLRTYVRRLRNKLEDNPPQIIITEYGEGYKFITPA